MEAGDPRALDPLDISIEIWNADETEVERVIAITNNRSVGFAAYFAAKEQFPSRTVIMRDRFGIISRWAARTV